MAGRLKFMAMALALGVSVPAFGVVQVTEHFNNDPSARGWSGVNNTSGGQNYGFSNTDTTGSAVNPPGGSATGAGEIGGSVARVNSPASFYGVDLGGALNLDTTDFTVTGVINVHGNGGSGLFIGYSNGAASFGSGGNAANFFGVQLDDGRTCIPISFTPAGGRDRAVLGSLTDDTTVPFSMTYDHTGNGGAGSMAFSMGAQSTTFTGYDNANWNPFTNFGIMPVSAAGGTSQVWIDDLTFTAVAPAPEPASVGLLSVVGLAALTRRRRRA